MKERLLCDYLDGRATAPQLADDLTDAYVQRSHDVRALHVEVMTGTFVVTRAAMLRVCEAVLEGELKPGLLEPIGDCIVMSESFRFDEADSELLEDVAHCWGAPGICYPLDTTHVRAFREWLDTGRNPLE